MSTTAVVVHAAGNEIGSRRALPNLIQLLRQGAEEVVYTCRPEDEAEARGIADAIGVDGFLVEENVPKAINRVIAKLGEHNLWLLSSDAVVSSAWNVYSAAALLTFAAVGPVGPMLTGSQHLKIPEEVLQKGDAAVMRMVQQSGGRLTRADSLDHCCMLLSAEALAKTGPLDAALLFEWSLLDWFVRLREINWRRPAAASGIFGGRLVPSDIPERPDISGRLAFYEKHEKHTVKADHKLFGLFLVSPQNRHQLALLRKSLASVAGRVDGVALVCVGELRAFDQAPGPTPVGRDAKLIAENDTSALITWASRYAGVTKGMCKVAHLTEDDEVQSVLWLEALGARLVKESGGTWALRMAEGEVLEDLPAEYLQRLMRHPNPCVVAYNVGITHHWGTMDLYRLDPPYGDGGDRTGANANDCRLFRPNGSKNATDGARVANIRLRNTALVDAQYHRDESSSDQMKLSRWSDSNRIGMHQLSYSGEDLEDVARWLDHMHGLCDRSVCVWTEELPATVEPVLRWYQGASLAFGGPMRTDFGAWRNRGIDALTDAASPFTQAHGLPTWGVFFDPDEWLSDPVVDLLPLRRMAESRDVWAYTVKAVNHKIDGPSSLSTSIRMHRLDVGLRYFGLVHESLSRSMREVGNGQDMSRRLRASPVQVHNRGSAEDPEGEKRERYEALVRQQLAEDPDSVTHWISLAWAYLEDGHVEEAESCLDQACKRSVGSEFLGWYERGMLHMRLAKLDLQAAFKRLQPGQVQHSIALQLLRSMGDAVPDLTGDMGDPPPLPSAHEE